MAATNSKTAIALEGGGALGAYSFGAPKYIYESEPDLQLSSISGVSIGAFTAAIVASHPDNPIDCLQSFWKDLTVFHSKLLPAAGGKVSCLFSQLEFLFATPRLLRFAAMDEFLRLEPHKGYSGQVRRFFADRTSRC
jgi:NTE family protein